MVSHHWARTEPDNSSPWTLQRVVHLHRRAAFAATWEELQRDLRDGPIVSVGRLLAGTACTARADFASTAQLLADAAVAGQEIYRLKAWWFYRMLFRRGPINRASHPLLAQSFRHRQQQGRGRCPDVPPKRHAASRQRAGALRRPAGRCCSWVGSALSIPLTPVSFTRGVQIKESVPPN